MCGGNDSGNTYAENFLVWQFIYVEHFHPWNSQPVVGVWWGCTETRAFRERVQRIQEWVGIHHVDYTFQPGRSRTYEHSASGGTDFGKPSRQFQICPLHWSELWKVYPTLSMYNWDTAVCVCMVGTKIRDVSSWKLMFGGNLSLLQSFKGVNGFPESMVTLWDNVSLFSSKQALMQWTHPSSLRATKCKVCQGAWRQWHLYSVLQESSYEHMLWHAVLTVLGY